ncbi:hypothetical protein [Pandoravirus japonicus]|uniref:Uncharacterized protein n=1 Tax=Pandoravirus japonicus TaxID=2823154 RepID=A0A811BNC8_9VIRU|nr:hypothetical protein [Pandoravirus japonicus]
MVFPVRFLFAFCVRASAGVPRCVLFFTGDVGLFLAVSSFFFRQPSFVAHGRVSPVGGGDDDDDTADNAVAFFCCVSQRKDAEKHDQSRKCAKESARQWQKKGGMIVRRSAGRGLASAHLSLMKKTGTPAPGTNRPFLLFAFAQDKTKSRDHKKKNACKRKGRNNAVHDKRKTKGPFGFFFLSLFFSFTCFFGGKAKSKGPGQAGVILPLNQNRPAVGVDRRRIRWTAACDGRAGGAACLCPVLADRPAAD